ncbi:MAG TPA: ubiquitin-like domain-containing protein [Anaerovoracaceae bacterium]|nr:ubiquitin-like domain-containing protein [Anaerovoracaceae bacterium]
MSKIYVDVNTPGNGKTYEFQLDSMMTVGQAKTRMIDEITEIENGNITLKPEKVELCDINAGKQLSDAETLRATGVKSGHRLILL